MRILALTVFASALAALALIAAVPAAAQQEPRQQEPPARVGRVSFIQGTLAFHIQGEAAWSAAAVNFPVAAGSAFWSDPKSRAELRIGTQTVDMAGNTDVEIAKLDKQATQLALPQGRIGVRLRQLGEGESVEIDIPRGGIWLLEPGRYDIDAGAADRPARVAVYEGSARFAAGTVEVAVKAGEAAVLSGAEPVVANIERAAPDEFAQWCSSRDYDLRRLAAPYRVSPRMTGFEELDEYGAWREVADYGEVWFPRSLAADWAPYRDGNWLWEEPWGWNWVGAEPWGFAPYHYGRWAYIDNAWGWAPGGFVADPVYAPALVVFLSDPLSVLAAAAAGPAVGWIPLGPGEAYWPWYSNDAGYLAAINTGSVGDPRNLGARPAGDAASANMKLANWRSATVVPQQAFARAERTGRAALGVDPEKARHAAVTAQAPAFHPANGHGRPMLVGAGAAAAAGAAVAAAPHVFAGRGAGRMQAAVAPHFAHSGRIAAPHWAGAPRYAGPRMGYAGRAHFAAPRMPRMAAPRMAHMAAPRFAAPRMPHFSGGGGPHGGGPRGGGGGGGPHGGGGGPHGGGGGKGHH